MRQSRAETGRLGEELTAYYLKKAGYEILKRNFRVKGGEIDIIAAKDGIIAFVEVRTRDENALAAGAATVDLRKKRLILKAASKYSLMNPHELQPRFDIAEVTVKNGKAVRMNYYDNAFDGGSDSTI